LQLAFACLGVQPAWDGHFFADVIGDILDLDDLCQDDASLFIDDVCSLSRRYLNCTTKAVANQSLL